MPKIEVPMPQMGESIAEGTVSRWLKQPGEAVERDEPILEISTDKVDAEIPAPSAGTLVDIQVEEGETVEVGTVVAFIDTEGGADSGGGAAPAAAEQEAAPAPETGVGAAGESEASVADQPASQPAADVNGREETADERLQRRSTPVVRRIAEEHGVDLSQVEGSGRAGRVTKQDIMAFIEGGGAEKQEAAPSKAPAPSKAAPSRTPAGAPSGGGVIGADELWSQFYGKVQHPEFPAREGDEVKPMDRIRKLTADHMVLAKRVAPHVHSFIEIDFTRINAIRKANKAKWAKAGNKVSFTAFVAWGIARVLPEFPMINGTVSGDNLIYRKNVNIGIAVDLNPGLIVPVVRDADHLSLVGIGNKIVDLADRARNKQLSPDEIQGGTFSITNPGVLGTMAGMPVIPKGTSAILGTGAIEKRVVVVEDPETGTDAMAIRKRAIFTLGYDHRVVDGADAARFLSRLKETLEDFPEDA
ncbi:MAG TPA: dihydrolipoamide acetyltransferase family protein [Longimicrobiales bacterium]|nr:dihydrolipoamide acetyltransferase family protein [Longimicrobiales bacterium]